MSAPTINNGDVHLVVDARVNFSETAKLFDHTGALLQKFPCLSVGTAGPRTDIPNGDTPPGLYHVLFVQQSLPGESASQIWAAYGEWFIDLFDDDGQERNVGRAGIAMHGGGSNLGIDPGDRTRPLGQRTRALAPKQPLTMTHGCLRFHNEHIAFLADLAKKVLARSKKFWVTVIQH